MLARQEPIGNSVSATFTDKPSKPEFCPPPGAVDAHCHVFGPTDRFPYASERKYTPVDASKRQLFALRDHLGFERNVIVQASCHGKDNAAMIDALRNSNGKSRGVAVVHEDISRQELEAMDDAGVRAVRFNFVKRLVDPTPKEVFLRIADKVAALGWHIVIYFEAPELEELIPFLTQLPTIVVIDHMGRPNIKAGIEGEGFQRFINFMGNNPNIWTKVSCPERLTAGGPPYSDVLPFSRQLVSLFPDRVLWGTDWPHPNMTHIPDDGLLTDLIPKIAVDHSLRQKLLVDNPMRLYWPEEVNKQ